MTKKNNELDADFPAKLGFLFQPARYKVCYGGRGGGRSWGFARALLLKGLQKPLRICCLREVQDSIKDSVHKLLSDQIKLLELETFYKVQDVYIRGRNGTEFSFTGLSTLTVDNIKSMEGLDVAWCEEAHKITKRSWTILIPTIRKDGSEIWASFNPELESDETYQRLIVKPPDDCVAVKLNWRDNPWFPEVLEKERLYCKKNNPKDYPNIWEGDCKPAVEGAIYYDEITAAQNQNRICDVPYDPFLKVHVVMDLGWNDFMAIGLIQRQASALRVIEYIEDDHKTLDFYSAMLKEKKLNWGKMWLPHDAYSKDIKTGKSTAAIMEKLGWNVPKRKEIVELSVEDGIKVTRMTFRRCYFDRTHTDRKDQDGYGSLIECLKRYRRRVNKQTDEPGAPLHDQFSHGADMFRYLCINADQMTNEDDKPFTDYHQGYGVLDAVVGF
ncbi:MAG: PBSX family phage terminase large subunit [Desulfobacteraceae bacterium]|nr:PBSX family phage terminase large subunit [Desulfobacteraceae bacterium]